MMKKFLAALALVLAVTMLGGSICCFAESPKSTEQSFVTDNYMTDGNDRHACEVYGAAAAIGEEILLDEDQMSHYDAATYLNPETFPASFMIAVPAEKDKAVGSGPKDFSAYKFTFVCFDEDQVVEGTVADGVVTVDYDLTGFMGGAAQEIWDDAVSREEAWETPVIEKTEAVEEETGE